MPPSKHTDDEENAFMAALLNDSSFVNTVPSSPVKASPCVKQDPVTPIKSRKTLKRVKSPKQPKEIDQVDVATTLDGIDDWDWNASPSPIKTSPKKSVKRCASKPSAVPLIVPLKSARPECTRCVVNSIEEHLIGGRTQKVLGVTAANERRSVILKDDWTHTDIQIGDVFNAIGSFTTARSDPKSPEIIISSRENLLIHHPDILITATAISNAPQCRRKPLLSALVKNTGPTVNSTNFSALMSDPNPVTGASMLYGNILHEVMQSCLKEGKWDERTVKDKIVEVVRKGLDALVELGVGIDEADREATNRAKGVIKFGERYVGQSAKHDAVLVDTRTSRDENANLLAITRLHDVEEDIWSPTYGLKGKLDASVQAVVIPAFAPNKRRLDFNPFDPASAPASGPKPLEIKTGRALAGMEHRAQTMLYTLLMEERYNEKVEDGLLYYTQSEEVVRVPRGRNEIRGLIIARNELAGWMMQRLRSGKSGKGGRTEKNGLEEDMGEVRKKVAEADVEDAFLPATVDDERTCKRCYVLDTCMLYRKAVENVEDTDSPISDAYALKTSHLTPVHRSFFKKWEKLISMEERDLVRFKKELWVMGAKEREEKGRCFSDMIIDDTFEPSEPLASGRKEGKIHQFTYRFIRANSEPKRKINSLLNGHMAVGDPVTVSVEPDLLALARGFIVDLTPTEVVLGVDHDLPLDLIRSRLQSRVKGPRDQVIFRIDKDDLFGGMSRVRDNLAQLFYAGGDTRRLQLVVDLKSPEFQSLKLGDIPEAQIVCKKATLNANQQEAMRKVFSAQDYALILGMPGTGKTTVISEIIRTLVTMGKTVLLTSYTHSAVDTILSKLSVGADFGILRLGNVDKVHPDILQYTMAARSPASTIEQLEQQLMAPPVVATTCLSIDHALFSRRIFDYCIVDEASQITLPTCLGPLRFADKFVLVGDHFQLPPLVRNPAAKSGGLDISLFRRLSEAHPHAVVDLVDQYRMSEDIMTLSNVLIYGDRLRCGNVEVAKRGLVLPCGKFLQTMHGPTRPSLCSEEGLDCWIERMMSESCKAVFVDTDAVPARDSRVGDLVQNEVEAKLVYQVTETLLRSGVTEEQIGIISLYRQQIKLLGHMLQERKGIEILTADRSQGRDKECIIISMVRSNEEGQMGDLVRDWRRMNVSFTRARSKLIILGSRTTLQATPLLSQFFDLMEDKGWILTLPPMADSLHAQAFSTRVDTNKRGAATLDDNGPDPLLSKANGLCEDMATYPRKRAKKAKVAEGLLRGRDILKDLVNDDM